MCLGIDGNLCLIYQTLKNKNHNKKIKNPRQEKIIQADTVTGDVKEIMKKEVRIALRMKNGKVVGPNEIPVEAKCIEETAIDVIKSF